MSGPGSARRPPETPLTSTGIPPLPESAARRFRSVLVTGGSGFIGSNFVRWLLGNPGFGGRVVNLDALTYAGNPDNLEDVAADPRYAFVRGDIADRAVVERVFAEHGVDAVAHFAAESHVDRSIEAPEAFVRTNVLGTFTLLDVARNAWRGRDGVLFHHVSTDEVFGSLGGAGAFTESTPYAPRSPYSASKAASDHLARAYGHTYGLPVTLTNCSNNYGPFQFPEKLIPLAILAMLEGKPLPVYGDGRHVRDWLHVEDHAAAVWSVMTRGGPGSCYNVGGGNERENLRLVDRLAELVAEEAGLPLRSLRSLVSLVEDRPGHDRRYAVDCSKIERELGWRPAVDFDEGLRRTVRWYVRHPHWIRRVRSGAYRTGTDRAGA